MDPSTEAKIIQKADMLAAELKTNGGTLDPDKGDRFLKRIVEAPTMINLVRTATMTSDTLVIPRIGLGTQFLQPAVANTALAADKRSKVVTDKLEFPSREVMGEIRIPYESLEDNIEGDDFIQTVLDLCAERAAIDLERLLILGDTASGDPFLALQDGILKRITSNICDLNGLPLDAATCQQAILTLPNKYRIQRGALRWLLNPDDQERLIGKIAARQTALGDNHLTGDAPLKLSKIISEMCGYLPDGTALLGNPKNFILGMRRQFTLESERLIGERQLRFVLTARVAIGVEDDEAAVKITEIGDDYPEE